MDAMKQTINRIIGNSQKQEADTQRRLDDTISRLTATKPSVVDRYTATPRPGYGGGTYQPQARATARDVISLFIPQDAFDGSWSDFQRAAREAIQWLRENRQCVERGGTLCWGEAFSLDLSTLAYRDSTGKRWYNAGIDTETAFYAAKLQAKA